MSGTLLDRFLERAARHGEREALRLLGEGGAAAEASWTWAEWERASRQVAGALLATGMTPGSRIAILAGNRPLWPIADLGILMAGMVSVGIYPTSAPGQVHRMLEDCGAELLLVDSAEQLDKVPPGCAVVAIDEVAAGRTMRWSEWLATGAPALGEGPLAGRVIERIDAARPDDAAILIYTSGSTGESKGAILTHRYLSASAAAIRDHLGFTDSDSSLSFLPFSHAAERVFGLYTRIEAGMACALVLDHTRIAESARAYQPTIFGGLPRLLEKAAETIRAAGPGAGLSAYFGGRVRLATSGGASFPAGAVGVLNDLGLEVLGGYGLTEHLCVSMHRPGRSDHDTAGEPIGGTRVEVAPDGELLVRRSSLTFAGYFGRPDETRAAFTDDGEWLRTGDLGEVTSTGRIRITGRKKELIALSTGKKVAPLPIEARLAEEPLIAQAMLFGESRPFIAALVWPRRGALERWARTEGIDGTWPALLRQSRVRDALQGAIDRVNAGLSRPEQIRAWSLLEREPTTESDELTPTLKLRRSVIAERHRDRFDALYQGRKS